MISKEVREEIYNEIASSDSFYKDMVYEDNPLWFYLSDEVLEKFNKFYERKEITGKTFLVFSVNDSNYYYEWLATNRPPNEKLKLETKIFRISHKEFLEIIMSDEDILQKFITIISLLGKVSD